MTVKNLINIHLFRGEKDHFGLMCDLSQGYLYLIVYKECFGLNLKGEIWDGVVDLG